MSDSLELLTQELPKKRRRKVRHGNEAEFFETPAWATQALIDRLGIRLQGSIMEPCVGEGAIANLLPGNEVWTNDLDPKRAADFHEDAGGPDLWSLYPSPDEPAANWRYRPDHYAWVVTNPPFSQAYRVLRQALEHTTVGVAMFLRISFLEATLERRGLLVERPPDYMLCLPRISFDGEGTDSVITVWMVWLHGKLPSWLKPIEVYNPATPPAEQGRLA